MFYFWLGIVIFLGIIEASTIGLVSIWFVISGIISLEFSNNPMKSAILECKPSIIDLRIFIILLELLHTAKILLIALLILFFC